MTGIERLHGIAKASRGYTWSQSLSDTLEEIAQQIERETDGGDYDAEEEEHAMLLNVCEAVIGDPGVMTSKEMQDKALSEIGKRLMPPGMEWPRYEDGKPVMIGDEFSADLTKKVDKVELVKCGFYLKTSRNDFYWYHKGVRVKRPKQEPVGADDLPIRKGDEVWAAKDGNGPFRVIGIDLGAEFPISLNRGDGGILMARCTPDELTHTKPVIGADHLPIKKGDTVYLLPGEWCDEYPCIGYHGGEELEVFEDGEPEHVDGAVQCRDKKKKKGALTLGTCYPQPHQLTHTKPDIMGADGQPLKVGDTVWDIEGGEHELVITSIELDELEHVKAKQEEPTPANVSIHPSRLTHTKPEKFVDSWERIEKDALKCVENNAGDKERMNLNMLSFVRRAKALAERKEE